MKNQTSQLGKLGTAFFALGRNGTLDNTHNKPGDAMHATAVDYLTRVMTQLAYVGICPWNFFKSTIT